MANANNAGVYYIDTSDTTLSGNVRIKSIKYMGNTSGTAALKVGSSAGVQIWDESGASNVWNPNVEIKTSEGINITLTNGAKVYIYTE